MFHTYFLGSSEGLLFDVPRDDYDTVLWAPLGRYLHSLGVEVRTGSAVHAVDLSPGTDGVRVEAGRRCGRGGGGRAGHRPGQLPPDCCSTLDLGDESWRQRVAGLRLAPPFGGLAALAGPAGECRPGRRSSAPAASVPLDNVTVLERFEAGAREWSNRHGGSVVELHAYALPAPVVDSEVRAGLRSPAEPGLPRAGRRGGAGRGVAGRAGLPAVQSRTVAAAAHGDHPGSADHARRRRHPLRLSGRVDGASRHHRVPRRQRAPGRRRDWRATTCGPSRCAAGTACCAPAAQRLSQAERETRGQPGNSPRWRSS